MWWENKHKRSETRDQWWWERKGKEEITKKILEFQEWRLKFSTRITLTKQEINIQRNDDLKFQKSRSLCIYFKYSNAENCYIKTDNLLTGWFPFTLIRTHLSWVRSESLRTWKTNGKLNEDWIVFSVDSVVARWIFDGFIIHQFTALFFPNASVSSFWLFEKINFREYEIWKNQRIEFPNVNDGSQPICSMSKMIFRSSEFLKIRKQYSLISRWEGKTLISCSIKMNVQYRAIQDSRLETQLTNSWFITKTYKQHKKVLAEMRTKRRRGSGTDGVRKVNQRTNR